MFLVGAALMLSPKAIVTGASRGIGKGIALELGRVGCTVYCTGRTFTEGASANKLPGTVGATADAVTSAGGKGIAVRVDHENDAEVS